MAAIEFGIVALPFMGFMFGVLETALTFWATQALETAVATASREIYTGQFQTNNKGKTSDQMTKSFQTSVCNNLAVVVDCSSQLKVDVRAFSSFSGSSVGNPVSNGAFDSSGFGYKPLSGQSQIGPDQVVVVRAALERTVYFSPTNLGTLANGNQLIMASAAFRTEPFPVTQ